MHFAFEGFRHEGGKRCFLFRHVDGDADLCFFSIEIELSLLTRNKVSVQEAPMFCLDMLRSALATGEAELDKLQKYQVQMNDFSSLLLERSKRETELRLRHVRRVTHARPMASQLPPDSLNRNVGRAF